jgi:hypothetical protein
MDADRQRREAHRALQAAIGPGEPAAEAASGTAITLDNGPMPNIEPMPNKAT